VEVAVRPTCWSCRRPLRLENKDYDYVVAYGRMRAVVEEKVLESRVVEKNKVLWELDAKFFLCPGCAVKALEKARGEAGDKSEELEGWTIEWVGKTWSFKVSAREAVEWLKKGKELFPKDVLEVVG